MNVKIIVVCACMLIPFRIFAQYNSDTTSYSKKEQGALETKKTGAIITILGALAVAAGMTLFNNDVDAGFAVGIGGLVATTIGLPIWIVGSVNHNSMTRKIIILFTMVGLLTGRVYAQQKTEVPVKIDYIKKVETYRKMRNSGTVLTVVGSVLAVAGTVKMSNLKSEGKYPYETTFTNGSVCIIAGYACLGAGLPLWIVGGINHKKYSKLRDLSINLNATPQSQGLTLTYRF